MEFGNAVAEVKLWQSSHVFGQDGLKASPDAFADSFPKADIDAFSDPVVAEGSEIRQAAKFANSVQGYVDVT